MSAAGSCLRAHPPQPRRLWRAGRGATRVPIDHRSARSGSGRGRVSPVRVEATLPPPRRCTSARGGATCSRTPPAAWPLRDAGPRALAGGCAGPGPAWLQHLDGDPVEAAGWGAAARTPPPVHACTRRRRRRGAAGAPVTRLRPAGPSAGRQRAGGQALPAAVSGFILRLCPPASPGVPPPAALGGVSYRTRRSFCRIRFDLTPRGLRRKKTHFDPPQKPQTSPAACSLNPFTVGTGR